MSVKKKMALILVTAVFFVCIGLMFYRIKSVAGVDVFKSFSWEQRWPLKLLHLNDDLNEEEILDPGVADLIVDSFDDDKSRQKWSTFWSERATVVHRRYAPDGRGGSRCLLIENPKGYFWTYSQRFIVGVSDNDSFRYEGWVRGAKGNPRVMFSVIVYDGNKKVLRWNDALQEMKLSLKWTPVSHDFQAPLGAAYLRFRISGSGDGETAFDDIRFWRQSPGSTAEAKTAT